MITNMDCIVSLSYMSQDKFFVFGDLCLFVIMYVAFYQYKNHVLLPYLDNMKDSVEIMKWYRRIEIAMFIQIGLMFLQAILLLVVPTPLNTHSLTPMMWVNTILFRIIMVLRFLIIVVSLNFIVMVSISLNKIVPNKILWVYFTVFLVLCLIYVNTSVNIVMPEFNRILSVYETFYNIRDIYLDKSTTKSYKDTTTNQLLDRLLCYFGGSLPEYTHDTVQKQLDITFKSYPNILNRKIDCSKSKTS